MKAIILGVVGLIVISTVMFAQNIDMEDDKKEDKLADTIEYIKRETIGGKLDFNSVLKGPEFLPIEHNGVRFNRNDYHVFLWGQAVSDSGLGSTENAIRLWEEIHDQKLTSPQRTALRIGYEKKLK